MGWDDEIKNKKDQATGAAKEHVGMATGDEAGDEPLAGEGRTDQAKSNVEQAGDKVKDAFRKD